MWGPSQVYSLPYHRRRKPQAVCLKSFEERSWTIRQYNTEDVRLFVAKDSLIKFTRRNRFLVPDIGYVFQEWRGWGPSAYTDASRCIYQTRVVWKGENHMKLLRLFLLRVMGTRPILFEFQCDEGAEELKFIHNIPSSLVNTRPQSRTEMPRT